MVLNLLFNIYSYMFKIFPKIIFYRNIEFSRIKREPKKYLI